MSDKLVISILNSLGIISVALAALCSIMLSDTYDNTVMSYENSQAPVLLVNAVVAEDEKTGPSPGTIFLSAPYAHFSR